MKAAWGSRKNSRPRGKTGGVGGGAETLAESQKEKGTAPSPNGYTTNRNSYTQTQWQLFMETQTTQQHVPSTQQPPTNPCLSQHTQAFSLWHSFTLSLLNRQRWTHAHQRAHMHTSLSFIPKYMKANLSHPLPAILSLQLSEALFPLLSQHCLLNLSGFSGKQFSRHCTPRILYFLWPQLSLVVHHPPHMK